MHSSTELTSDMFTTRRGGQRLSSFADLCPGFSSQDRLGVIVRHPFGAVWRSNLIVSAVTAFYDEQRNLSQDFYIYPDYFVFHVGCFRSDLGMLDVWPEHKVLTVEDDPETVLRAVNDRGITLLAMDGVEREVRLEEYTKNSALSRIRQVFLSSTDGEIEILGNAVVEKYLGHVLKDTKCITDEVRKEVWEQRAKALERDGAVEYYRAISISEGLRYL